MLESEYIAAAVLDLQTEYPDWTVRALGAKAEIATQSLYVDVSVSESRPSEGSRWNSTGQDATGVLIVKLTVRARVHWKYVSTSAHTRATVRDVGNAILSWSHEWVPDTVGADGTGALPSVALGTETITDTDAYGETRSDEIIVDVLWETEIKPTARLDGVGPVVPSPAGPIIETIPTDIFAEIEGDNIDDYQVTLVP